MTLQDWITANGGAHKLAKKLGLNYHTVRKWFLKQRVPKHEAILFLVKAAKGALTYESICHDTRQNTKGVR